MVMSRIPVWAGVAASHLFLSTFFVLGASAGSYDNLAAGGSAIVVSLAASLRQPVEILKPAWSKAHPDIELALNFGASGALQQQIEQGAPVDVFLPASPKQMDALEAAGRIIPQTRINLLTNRLVLITPAISAGIMSFEELRQPRVRLVALGDPASVPAGEYGRQVLQSLALWDAIKPKLILAKDVRQVLSYIETGNADAGIVYASDAAASRRVRIAAEAPPGSHAPVLYPVAVLRDAKNPEGARAFIGFLRSPAAQRVFREQGFLTEHRPPAERKQPDSAFDWSPLWISVKTSLVATALTFFAGVWIAYAMSRYRGKARAWIDGVLSLPLVLPPTVIGFFLLLAFGRNSGVGQWLEKIGITIVFSWTATVIAASVVAFPLMYRTALGGFEQLTPTLLDAARTLGASEWRVFRRIAFPLAWPGIMAGTILAFARALGEFGATLMLAGNIPGRTQTMPVAIFFAAEAGEMNRAAGWVLLIIAVSLAVIALFHYWSGVRPTRVFRVGAGAALDPLPAKPRAGGSYRVLRRSPGSGAPDLHMSFVRNLDGFRMRMTLQARNGALGILGASGAGKSMMLRYLAGIESPDEGRIVLNGRVLFDSSSHVNIAPSMRQIGILFQDYALFPHLTAGENIAFGIHALPKLEREQRIRDIVNFLGLAELMHRYPSELSGGQRQRVALARALAVEPEALLLDEPFSALDPHLRRQIEEELRTALAGYEGVVLFVTHDVQEAFRFCENLAVLDGGEVIAAGPKHQLFDQPVRTRIARLTGCKNIVRAERISETHVRVPDWDCELAVPAGTLAEITHVGIRAHHLKIVDTMQALCNVFPCWRTAISEAPHEMTVYLRLHHPPQEGDVPHIQMEVSKDEWRRLEPSREPWKVFLDPAKLLLLRD